MFDIMKMGHIIIWKLGNVDFMIRANGDLEWNETSRKKPTDSELTQWKKEYDEAKSSTAYIMQRKKEYNSRGVTLEAMTIAMFEGDQTEISKLQTIREEVKAEYPKA